MRRDARRLRAPLRFQRLFAERHGGVWWAFQDTVPTEPDWTIRLNGSAATVLRSALDIR